MERFNKLLKEVKKNLSSLINAIKGTEVMSQKLEAIFNCFLNNKVPDAWMDVSLGYPSLKPLNSWVEDLVARLEFISSWVVDGPPKTFWVASFFFPQGFMTATMQTYARSTGKPIDTLGFRTHVLDVCILVLQYCGNSCESVVCQPSKCSNLQEQNTLSHVSE